MMATQEGALEANQPIRHEQHGRGRVVADLGETVVVRFSGKIEQLPRAELSVVPSISSSLTATSLSEPDQVLLRAQALSIRSVNDQWGVFSRSRVQLLPHQLWVCHQVTQHWPFRWLVADDVGLGKTIECGLVLLPLQAANKVRRLLILTPARLVAQWRYRMKDMFDIRLTPYVREADDPRLDFWGTHSAVVASFHTLRADNRGARSRLLEAEPWDLVVVDEAHHLSVDDRGAETLAYSLLSELQERRKINSLLFFTGTPHRGKDAAFFGLMELIRPDLFDPKKDKWDLLSNLSAAMIRNNKAQVTDLQGRKLFLPHEVHTREHVYSETEAAFYRTLSEFIIDGRAYAGDMTGRAQTARMLVLITLQKLAASSIAAIRRALERRQTMLAERKEAIGASKPGRDELDAETLDERAEQEEQLAENAAVLLMEDEILRLGELIALSHRVETETKIERLITMIRDELPADEPLLLFTEYKATQALVVDALHAAFGMGCATFINGDERLTGLALGPETIACDRDTAADAFNAGRVRFLVSTEAAGEGIDLQERCATLVHVDMPWNPMRLHQRVGRLSRYGQSRPVTVYILRNPETVEARIWDLLNEKLARIQSALSSVMEEQEDIARLVIGMAGNTLFDELFSEAASQGPQGLKSWFDDKSATLGGEDVVEMARAMLGNVARFDFQEVGRDVPHVDLPDLEPFFLQTMSNYGRRVFRRDDGYQVLTPEAWVERDYALQDRYAGLVFDRTLRGEAAASRVLGIGHVLFDTALAEAAEQPAAVAIFEKLPAAILLIVVEDEVTGGSAAVTRVVVGVEDGPEGPEVLRDWELLQRLNAIMPPPRPGAALSSPPPETGAVVDRLMAPVDDQLEWLVPAMRRPVALPELLLLPRA